MLLNDFEPHEFYLSRRSSNDFEVETPDADRLIQLRETLVFMQDQSADCQIIFRLGKMQVKQFIGTFYLQTGRQDIFRLIQSFGHIVRRVMFVFYLSENLLDKILQTTTAKVFFCCMKSFISFCADMFSGTMGTS